MLRQRPLLAHLHLMLYLQQLSPWSSTPTRGTELWHFFKPICGSQLCNADWVVWKRLNALRKKDGLLSRSVTRLGSVKKRWAEPGKHLGCWRWIGANGSSEIRNKVHSWSWLLLNWCSSTSTSRRLEDVQPSPTHLSLGNSFLEEIIDIGKSSGVSLSS